MEIFAQLLTRALNGKMKLLLRLCEIFFTNLKMNDVEAFYFLNKMEGSWSNYNETSQSTTCKDLIDNNRLDDIRFDGNCD